MHRLAALCVIAACTAKPAGIDAPAGDSARDSAAIDAPADADPCATERLWQDMFACGCCGEGQAICVQVVVDMGTIVDVVAGTDYPPTAEYLACVKARIVGKCFSSADPRVCVYGI